MKEKRENYVKPLSYVIESEQPLMAGSLSISDKPEYRPGAMGVRRYEDYEEEDDWSK
jgi:hypothetical protein